MQGQQEEIRVGDLPIHGTHRPIVQDVYDFSALDVPSSWDSTFNIGQQAVDHFALHMPSHPSEASAPSHAAHPPIPNVPITHVIPPTPVKASLTSDSRRNLDAESGAALVGRRSEEANAAIEKQFNFIDGAINELVASTGIPVHQVLNLFMKSRGRIHNATNHWNIYGQYFKLYCLQELERAGKDRNVISKLIVFLPTTLIDSFVHLVTSTIQRDCYKCFQDTYPDTWQEILTTFDEAQTSSGPPLTVMQWSHEFTRLSRKVTTLVRLVLCNLLVLMKSPVGFCHCETWL